jgi:enamine deaminase RidA (YjgF/YER057c/UK114 family)
LGEIRRRRGAGGAPPSVTTIVVSALARPEYLIEIEVAAAASD